MRVDIDEAIGHFWAARARGEYFPRAYEGRLTIDQAYLIQLALIDRRVAAGERHIGWKVGLTAKAVQEQFGFHEPLFGCVLETKSSGHVYGAAELIKPGFETELCLQLRHGLDGVVSLDEVKAAVETVYPSFEIIETRGDILKHIPLAVVDNSQMHSIVLGAPVPFRPQMDLSAVRATVKLNGQEIAASDGTAVLSNPLNSVVWLSSKLAQFGRRLRADDFIMTGSFVRQFPLMPGDRAAADFTGIGHVEARVAPA